MGQEDGRVSIYDARTSQQLRQLSPHGGRVGVLATLPQTVSSGSADRLIFHRDLRIRNEVVRVVKGYKAEVTALQWSSEGELASGGNDNSVRVFKGFDDVSSPGKLQIVDSRRRLRRCAPIADGAETIPQATESSFGSDQSISLVTSPTRTPRYRRRYRRSKPSFLEHEDWIIDEGN